MKVGIPHTHTLVASCGLQLFFCETQYNADAHIHVHILTPMNARTHTLPYEHLRKTEPAGRVLRLTKSPRAPRCRRERRLPLKNILSKWKTPASNLGFELWWAGGTTTLLTILPLAGSLTCLKLSSSISLSPSFSPMPLLSTLALHITNEHHNAKASSSSMAAVISRSTVSSTMTLAHLCGSGKNCRNYCKSKLGWTV